MRKRKVLIEWDVRNEIDNAIMERMQTAADLCLNCENVKTYVKNRLMTQTI